MRRARREAHVLVTWPGYSVEASDVGGELTKRNLKVLLAPKVGPRTERELIDLARGCVAVIASTDPFSDEVLAALPDLRVVARVGVGTDSIDILSATRRGVVITAARGMNEDTVADHALALMLASLRRVVPHDAAVREGRWDRTGPLVGADLHHKVVGLVGLGAIGRAVARRLHGFDVRVVAYDVAPQQVLGVEMVPLQKLLRIADIVSIHVPLTSSTRGLIGAPELAAMKPEAVLVNTARGAIVDEPALVAALQTRRLYAALDVFAHEPPDASPLLEMRAQTVLAPHVAGLTTESIRAMERHATLAVVSVLEGSAPDGIQNPGVDEHALSHAWKFEF